jgi:hypothetical protein
MEVYVVAHFAGLTYDRGCMKSHLRSNTHTYSSELYAYSSEVHVYKSELILHCTCISYDAV